MLPIEAGSPGGLSFASSYAGRACRLLLALLLTAVMVLTVDAAVSRHVAGVEERILSREAWGVLAPTVVIHIGTNGPAGEDELDDLARTLRG